jgi:hypothetical protein
MIAAANCWPSDRRNRPNITILRLSNDVTYTDPASGATWLLPLEISTKHQPIPRDSKLAGHEREHLVNALLAYRGANYMSILPAANYPAIQIRYRSHTLIVYVLL